MSTLIANRYEEVNKLGAGAMGAVYHTRDRLTGQEVALKRVSLGVDDLEFNSRMATDDNPRMALANEFQTLASLRHPNIVSVLDYGFDRERQPYFTMSLLNTPQTILQAGREQPFDVQIKLIIALLEALAYLHRRGILHRDLKPPNVLVSDGQVYVLDFGLAVSRDADAGEQTAGTLSYMAPEVLTGGAPSEAADLYAVGVMAYEIFSGHYPFPAESVGTLIQDVIYTAPDMSVLDLDPALEAVIERLLAKSPEVRYTDVYSTLRDLCLAANVPLPEETVAIRESYLQAAKFVGRGDELRTLRDALHNLIDHGAGSRYLVGGESGVGKSRLLNEIRTRAMVAGALVLRGQASNDSGLAYVTWRDVLRRLALLVTLGEEEARILKLIVPDLAVLVGYPVDDPPDMGNDTQKRLLMVIENVFRRALRQQPIVLVLEDLQWADESLKVLTPLSQITHELPLMILGSYRNDEAPDLPERLPDMDVIALSRLGEEEITQLSMSMLGEASARPGVVELLNRETEGNVFFIVEVVRALAEEAGSLNRIGMETLPPQVFAGGVERVIRRRLQRVPEWAFSLLEVAAVAGRQLDLKLLARFQTDLDEWLTACANAAVFDNADERWRFAHDKLRERLLADMDASHKAQHHRQVAEGIEHIYADHLDDYAVSLVHHWGEAGDTRKEGAYLLIAGQQMMTRNEYREARRLYERALALKIHEHTDNTQKILADIYYGIGRAAYNLSDYKVVQEVQTKALALYTELDDTFGIAEATFALGEIRMRQGRFAESLPLVEESLRLYKTLNDTKKIAYGYMNLGVIAFRQDDLETGRTYFKQAYEMMQTVDDPLALARSLNNLGNVTDMLGHTEEAVGYHQEALRIRREINDRHGIAYSLSNLGMLYKDQGDEDAALQYINDGLDILRTLGEKMAMAMAFDALSGLYLEKGRYADAHHAAEEAITLQRYIGNDNGVAESLKTLGNVARATGDYAAAWTHYRQAIGTARKADSERTIRNVMFSVGKLLAETGQIMQAVEVMAYLKAHVGNDHFLKQIDESLAIFKTELPDAAFDLAVQRSKTRTLDTLVASALVGNPE